jgi:protein-S-isoprenylcysteine O-methyltransferase Ste14
MSDLVVNRSIPSFAGETAARPHPVRVCFAVALMVLLPPLVYYLWICATAYQGALVWPTTTNELSELIARVPAPTLASVLIFAGWFLFQALFQAAVPGPAREGTPLADGRRLTYPMNGWTSFCITLLLFGIGVAAGWVRPAVVYDQFGPLLTTVNVFTFAFCVYLYVEGKRGPSPEPGTGNLLYDYFMGTRLNPRLGSFDWKFFCEARPGLIAWVVINFCFAAKQHELHGQVTWAMVLVNAMQFLYVADYFWHEEAILTTWDIKHERFGWMLCWGDLVWVPFTYTLQALYLVHHPHDLPGWAIAGIVVLNMAGYAIFRGANWQKHCFRTNPEGLIWGKPPESIATPKGTLLLTSGWWGISRHMNYLGDWMMALAWSLPCRFGHVLPYFYFVYFLILLVHRERRDHAMCLDKYGPAWEEYCRKVPWRIIPWVY